MTKPPNYTDIRTTAEEALKGISGNGPTPPTATEETNFQPSYLNTRKGTSELLQEHPNIILDAITVTNIYIYMCVCVCVCVWIFHIM
jgi:hypothetical protein